MLCDSTMKIRTGYVDAQANVLNPNILPFGQALAGNIAPQAAAAMFSQMWAVALQTLEEDMPTGAFVNSAARVLFGLRGNQDSSFEFNISSSEVPDYTESMMDLMAPNLTWAYMSGFAGVGKANSTIAQFYKRTDEVDGFFVNGPFSLATCVMTISITVLLVIIANFRSGEDRRPLDVKTLLEFTGNTLVEVAVPAHAHRTDEEQRNDLLA